MPRVGFKPMTPVFEAAKTVHVLDKGNITLKVCNGGIYVGILLCLTPDRPSALAFDVRGRVSKQVTNGYKT
jgi:hypothetical protein